MRRDPAVVVAAVRTCAGITLALLLAAPPGRAQEPSAVPGTIAVFEDCQTFGCDFDFFRTEIPWVDWVRDRESADVHLLVTSQTTGGGGRRYTLEFLGRDGLEDRESQLTYTASADDTRDEVRRGLARAIQRGLLPYVAGTEVSERLTVEYDAPAAAAGQSPADEPVEDPWNYWVFTTRLSGFLNGQSTTSSVSLNGSVSANRTTETWKFSLGANYSRRESEFDLVDRVVESVVEDWGARGLGVYSLATHWSAGLTTRAGRTTFRNQDLYVRLAPGLEYSVFPYAESTRRQVTLLYSVGVNHWEYAEETLFRQTSETRWDQTLTAQVDFTQPWGQASIFGEAAHYLHDTSKWHASVGGNVSVRLFKGFSLNFGGNYSWIRDQLFIPLGGATDDEILTRQRQLSTAYEYFTNFGVSYRFGSIFNNVVNPRFGGGGGGGIVIF